MVVLVLTAVPVGLRGFITRWLLEISPGVFVGRVTVRVREALWSRVVEMCNNGRAIMVFSADNEQRLDFRVHRHDWEVVDLDGVSLIRRPHDSDTTKNPMKPGWSKAAKYRRARRK
ncbi:type I-E CRISPR-associated endoribonuclease Cas2 [Enemella evansiae]|uniref:Type I-E CRISPR-associated endoribonuclease Cas2 n=1 Tax=Enemella evansiae TaxID=2016499 RepID=A0A255GPL9_9ACTN|nr:type I-E CRISPR-associated endoribonuclease Cas2e [Enemella evansiae]OYO17767.1 type I-E CRISPR-associated endoribonuclease Cas2 [Enemella evansiae]